MPATVSTIPKKMRDLVADLRIAEEVPNGRPILTPEQASLARRWLTRALLHGEDFCGYLRLLQEFYHGKFAPPLPRWLSEDRVPYGVRSDPNAGFRHYELLPEDKAQAVAERGLDALSDDELAVLLLNPFALWDLSDLINTLMAPYWHEHMSTVGKELIAKYDLEIPLPGVDLPGPVSYAEMRAWRKRQKLALLRGAAGAEPEDADTRRLTFTDDAARALERKTAESLYGDANANVRFTLRLHRLRAEAPEQFRAQLSVEPAPTHNALTLTLTFPTGDRRAFTLRVPPRSPDPEDEPPASARSLPCEPLPAEAFELTGAAVWKEDAQPLELSCTLFGHKMRSGKCKIFLASRRDHRTLDMFSQLQPQGCSATIHAFSLSPMLLPSSLFACSTKGGEAEFQQLKRVCKTTMSRISLLRLCRMVLFDNLE